MNARTSSEIGRRRAHEAAQPGAMERSPSRTPPKSVTVENVSHPPTLGELALSPLLFISIALGIFLVLAAVFIGLD